MQIVFTAIDTALAIHTFVEPMTGEKTILGVLFAVFYLLSFVALSLYACVAYKNPSDFPFQLVIHAYAALLGIQILQNGQFLSGPDLGEGLVLFINVANLALSLTTGPSMFGPLGIVLISTFALSFALFFYDRFRPTILYKLALPLIVAGLLLAAWLHLGTPVATLSANAGNIAFELFLLITLAEGCLRYRINE